jgi:hypothetical protein
VHRNLLGYYNLCAMMIGLIAHIFETSKCPFQCANVLCYLSLRYSLKLVYNENAKGVYEDSECCFVFSDRGGLFHFEHAVFA